MVNLSMSTVLTSDPELISSPIAAPAIRIATAPTNSPAGSVITLERSTRAVMAGPSARAPAAASLRMVSVPSGRLSEPVASVWPVLAS
jgi:hypothetical protein